MHGKHNFSSHTNITANMLASSVQGKQNISSCFVSTAQASVKSVYVGHNLH